MKKATALLLSIVVCLYLCACAGNGENGATETTQSNNGTPNGDSGSAVVYDHTFRHPLIDTIYGEWVLDANLSWMVMPTKIIFKNDGTCFAEFPEYATSQTMDLCWGIVEDSLEEKTNLYIYIGVEDDIWYLFGIGNAIFNCGPSGENFVFIAAHSIDPVEGMISIDGLSKDGYTGMLFEMKKVGA